jgi:hypothetical protein
MRAGFTLAVARARPSTIWGSKVGIFFDFQIAEALDDDAVEATLDTNQLNLITDMISVAETCRSLLRVASSMCRKVALIRSPR